MLIRWLALVAIVLPLGAFAQPAAPIIQPEVRAIGAVPGSMQQVFGTEAVRAAVNQAIEANGYRAGAGVEGVPVATYVLRVQYIVHAQPGADTPLVAASASTQLLEGSDIGGGRLTLALYDGIQQSVRQASELAEAGIAVREAFDTELADRIGKALAHLDRLRR
ncbi:MAG: hypothetical protein RJQ08_05570 [Salinisphaeraceae bacterium]